MKPLSTTISTVLVALLFFAVGGFFRRKDLFSAFDHPLVKKYPNISKRFGTAIQCVSLIWLSLVLILTLAIRL